jgi:carbonic anhydrase
MKKVSLFLACFQVLLAASPQESLERLIEGNRHYVEDNLRSLDRSSYRREELLLKQNPFAVIVGCSDSRVPPEIIFDQGLGDLFVVRVAGQVAGPIELDSIDYAIQVLGASLVVVLGHESCGAVKAVLSGNTAGIEEIARLIKPALRGVKPADLEMAVKENVKWTISYLKSTPIIKKMVKEGKLAVIGGYYNLSDGHVEILHK